MTRRHLSVLAPAAMAAMLLAGCGGGAPKNVPFGSGKAKKVDGRITMGGEPVKNAKLVFKATNGDAVRYGATKRNGEYIVLDVPYGNYEVTITTADKKVKKVVHMAVDQEEMADEHFSLP